MLNSKYDGYHRGLASMVYKLRNQDIGASVNEQLARGLHKPVIKKLKRRKVYASLKIVFMHLI